MDGTRRSIEPDQVTDIVRAAFGPAQRLNSMERLRGGSKKGVYRLTMYFSLVAGPLRLLDGDFPEREAMMGIAQSNLQRVLTFLR